MGVVIFLDRPGFVVGAEAALPAPARAVCSPVPYRAESITKGLPGADDKSTRDEDDARMLRLNPSALD